MSPRLSWAQFNSCSPVTVASFHVPCRVTSDRTVLLRPAAVCHKCSFRTDDLRWFCFQECSRHTHSQWWQNNLSSWFKMKRVWTETSRLLRTDSTHVIQVQTEHFCCSAASEQRDQSDSQRSSAFVKGRRHTLIGCSLTHLSDRWSESAPISAERFWHSNTKKARTKEFSLSLMSTATCSEYTDVVWSH